MNLIPLYFDKCSFNYLGTKESGKQSRRGECLNPFSRDTQLIFLSFVFKMVPMKLSNEYQGFPLHFSRKLIHGLGNQYGGESRNVNIYLTVSRLHWSHPFKTLVRDFPGGPVVKTPYSQCKGSGFDPWSGNYIPHAATTRSHMPQLRLGADK